MFFIGDIFKKYRNKSDEWLLTLYRQKEDTEILSVLFERYVAMLFGVSRKYLGSDFQCEDAVMHVFESLPGLVLKSEVKNFRSWVYVVMKNHCLMELRKQKHSTTSIDSVENNERFVEFDPFEHPTNEHEAKLNNLEYCLEQLKAEQKTCITLFYIEKQCYADIAHQSRLDIKKVKSAIQNGKRNLKNCIEQRNG